VKAISLLANGQPLFNADSITKGLTTVERKNLTHLSKDFDEFLMKHPLLDKVIFDKPSQLPNTELLTQLSGAGPNNRVATLSAIADAVALRCSKV